MKNAHSLLGPRNEVKGYRKRDAYPYSHAATTALCGDGDVPKQDAVASARAKHCCRDVMAFRSLTQDERGHT